MTANSQSSADAPAPGVPNVVPCDNCGHNLTNGVHVVRRTATTQELWTRANWGTMEKHVVDHLGADKTTVECCECETKITIAQEKLLWPQGRA